MNNYRFVDLKKKHELTDKQLAKLLGVPITTLRGWLYGVRDCGASTLRVLDMLEMIEIHAPRLYDEMLDLATS
jgi:DNA-binding transcriptional regulator YiaG